MNGTLSSQKIIIGFCLLLSIAIGCGKEESHKDEEQKESKADVTVTMPDADVEKEAGDTAASEFDERLKTGETVRIEGIIHAPFLADKSQEYVKATSLYIKISYIRPAGNISIANTGRAYLTSLGNNNYRYRGELRGPLRAGNYWVDVSYDAKKIASKKLVVTE